MVLSVNQRSAQTEAEVTSVFLSLQACELVKFMIEHCQRILGDDPSSLFGGPPQRLNAEETGSGAEITGTRAGNDDDRLNLTEALSPQTGSTP